MSSGDQPLPGEHFTDYHLPSSVTQYFRYRKTFWEGLELDLETRGGENTSVVRNNEKDRAVRVGDSFESGIRQVTSWVGRFRPEENGPYF